MASAGHFEIRTAEYRPCYVCDATAYSDGREVIRHERKALFHRWTEKDKLIIKTDGRFSLKPHIIKEQLKEFEQRGFVGPGLGAEHVKHTLAIVEYEDGTIEEVEPCDVRFVPGLMNEYDFTEAVMNETGNAVD